MKFDEAIEKATASPEMEDLLKEPLETLQNSFVRQQESAILQFLGADNLVHAVELLEMYKRFGVSFEMIVTNLPPEVEHENGRVTYRARQTVQFKIKLLPIPEAQEEGSDEEVAHDPYCGYVPRDLDGLPGPWECTCGADERTSRPDPGQQSQRDPRGFTPIWGVLEGLRKDSDLGAHPEG